MAATPENPPSWRNAQRPREILISVFQFQSCWCLQLHTKTLKAPKKSHCMRENTHNNLRKSGQLIPNSTTKMCFRARHLRFGTHDILYPLCTAFTLQQLAQVIINQPAADVAIEALPSAAG